MNYKKVIKDLKERNDKLQEQYRLRDIRCIHLEYENEMLKGDFEAQHELTKKYAEENQDLKKQLENYKKLGFKHLQDKNNNLENQQKEFIEYLEDLIKQNETVVEVSKYGLPKNCSKLLIDFYKEILSKYKEIIGNNE